MLSRFSCVSLCYPRTVTCQPPLCWDSPGENTGVGSHAFLQGLFPTRGSNPFSYVSALAGVFVTTSTTWGNVSLSNFTHHTFYWSLRTVHKWLRGPFFQRSPMPLDFVFQFEKLKIHPICKYAKYHLGLRPTLISQAD